MRGADPARVDGSAAVAQPPEPPGPPEEDEVERADHGTLPPWGRGSDLSGPLSAWWSHQEQPAGSIRWRPRHLHLPCPPRGGQRGVRLSRSGVGFDTDGPTASKRWQDTPP